MVNHRGLRSGSAVRLLLTPPHYFFFDGHYLSCISSSRVKKLDDAGDFEASQSNSRPHRFLIEIRVEDKEEEGSEDDELSEYEEQGESFYEGSRSSVVRYVIRFTYLNFLKPFSLLGRRKASMKGSESNHRGL